MPWGDTEEASHLLPANQTQLTDFPTLPTAPCPFGKALTPKQLPVASGHEQFEAGLGFTLAEVGLSLSMH